MEKGNLILASLKGGKPEAYFFSEKLTRGQQVVIDVDGCDFLAVVQGITRKAPQCEKPSSIIRVATEDDIKKHNENLKKAEEALKMAKEKAKKYDFEMKLVACEYALDGSKLVFSFTSENRVDFRDFVKELAAYFKNRIELKQIGDRDETKIMGGLGACGKVCCCNEFLSDFAKVSIKMAKTQNLSLNPQKINGLCGRLMCCLSYENEAYAKVMARMPKQNSEVETPEGKGIAIYNDVLNEKVSVKIIEKDESFTIKDFDLKDVKVKVYAIKES